MGVTATLLPSMVYVKNIKGRGRRPEKPDSGYPINAGHLDRAALSLGVELDGAAGIGVENLKLATNY